MCASDWSLESHNTFAFANQKNHWTNNPHFHPLIDESGLIAFNVRYCAGKKFACHGWCQTGKVVRSYILLFIRKELRSFQTFVHIMLQLYIRRWKMWHRFSESELFVASANKFVSITQVSPKSDYTRPFIFDFCFMFLRNSVRLECGISASSTMTNGNYVGWFHSLITNYERRKKENTTDMNKYLSKALTAT